MKFSIIIPIYNTGEYKLRRCLDSIINQTFTDFECLMIDDGSTDVSGAICDEYVQKDSRFIAFHKDNGGVSSARNLGLKQMKGEWCQFVDSDDYLEEDHLLLFINEIQNNSKVDLIVSGFKVNPDLCDYKHTYKHRFYAHKTSLNSFLEETDVLSFMILWDKLFYTEKIKKQNLRFDEKLCISEDRLFCYQYMYNVNNILALHNSSYIHDTTDINSLTNRVHSLSIQKYKFKILSKAKFTLIKSLGCKKEVVQMLNSYNENLLVTMLNSGGTVCTLLSLLQYDPLTIIKLLIKRYIRR